MIQLLRQHSRLKLAFSLFFIMSLTSVYWLLDIGSHNYTSELNAHKYSMVYSTLDIFNNYEQTSLRPAIPELSVKTLKLSQAKSEYRSSSVVVTVPNKLSSKSPDINRKYYNLLQELKLPPYTPLTEALLKHPSFSNDSIIEDVIRSEFGLQSYVTESGEEIWTENGVQYRPFPYKEPKDSKYYNSEFEAYIPFNETKFFEGRPAHPSFRKGMKKIIIWWQHKVGQASIDGLETLRACPEFPCVIASDRQYTNVSSALLVDAQFVNNEPPPDRRKDQIFVHYQVEAQTGEQYWWFGNLYKNYETWNTAFNWTMSYRRDSDIRTYYGLIRKRNHIKEKNYTSILSLKNRTVAWLVSHCDTNSKREDYVNKLQAFLNVDVFGNCGVFQCARDNDKTCFKDIQQKYKFYLAFESNLCKDYITEKLYRFFDGDIILVARGSNFYSSNLPSETFINTADFKSPEELAKRIIYLDSHDEAYIAMLKEKDKYFSIYEDYLLTQVDPLFVEYRYEAVPMCQLCQRLWNMGQNAKIIPDILKWISLEEYQCRSIVSNVTLS